VSGHSKWSQIKRQKGVADARRGQVFTKLGREIAVAVRRGGPDSEGNFRLRLAIQRARESNMPVDNIERAIKRAAGQGGEGEQFLEMTYEGYGPGGAALLLQALTDNRNRTASEIRSTLTRNGGNLGEAGSVAWNFEPKGLIVVEPCDNKGEEMALLAIDAGAQDFKLEDSSLEIYTKPEDMESVRRTLEERQVPIASAEHSMVPKTTIMLDQEVALRTLKLMDKLESLDDIQRVYSNADFPPEALKAYEEES